MKKATKAITVFLMFALMIISSYAFGIYPARQTVDFDSDLNQEFSFRIRNSEQKDLDMIVYSRGELQEYVTIKDKILHISADEEYAEVKFRVNVPYSKRKPGSNLIEIVVEEAASDYNMQTGIGGKTALVYQLLLDSPFFGQYMDVKFHTNSFGPFDKVEFTYTLYNKGTEPIDGSYIEIEIYDENGNLIGKQRKDFDMLGFEEERKEEVPLDFDLQPGNYKIISTVYYSNKKIRDERDFVVGGPYIEIEALGSSNFVLGMINEIGVSVYSRWSEELKNVYAELVVTDRNKDVQNIFNTLPADIQPFSGKTLIGYWDTKSLIPDKYNVKATLKYEGQKSEKEFEVVVSRNEFRSSLIGLSGNVPAGKSKLFDPSLPILIIAIVVLIILNIILLAYIKKNSGNKGNQGKNYQEYNLFNQNSNSETSNSANGNQLDRKY